MKGLSLLVLCCSASSVCFGSPVSAPSACLASLALGQSKAAPVPKASEKTLIADHRTAYLRLLEPAQVVLASRRLVLAYGHTSHGSQIVDGMQGLMDAVGAPFIVGQGGLDLRDTPFSGADDLGSPSFRAWVDPTASYLGRHPEVNAVMWSWCGQLSWAGPQDVLNYLSDMTALEARFPKVMFIYMTGHLDGTGPGGTLHQNNEMIRAYCRAKGRILYDFADIERYDPDGRDYLAMGATDACDYDSDGDGVLDSNWATAWQDSHPGQWYWCGSAHTQPLNGNRKTYAAWWLLSHLPSPTGRVRN